MFPKTEIKEEPDEDIMDGLGDETLQKSDLVLLPKIELKSEPEEEMNEEEGSKTAWRRVMEEDPLAPSPKREAKIELSEDVADYLGDGTTLESDLILRPKIVVKSEPNEDINEEEDSERTLTQLKKFWANLKQQQREAKTRETQARLATGGGPEVPPADPEIEAITPHLMETAPCAFTSNCTPAEIEQNLTNLIDIHGVLISMDNDDEVMPDAREENKNNSVETTSSDVFPLSRNIGQTRKSVTPGCNLKRKRSMIGRSQDACSAEDEAKAERVRKLTSLEEEAITCKVQLEREEMEEKLRHMKRRNEIAERTALADERTALAKAELAELELKAAKQRLLL